MINLSKCFLTELLYVLKIVIWVNKILKRRPNLQKNLLAIMQRPKKSSPKAQM